MAGFINTSAKIAALVLNRLYGEASTNDLTDSDSTVNRTFKGRPRRVWEIDKKRPVFTDASSPTEPWRDALGNIVISPFKSYTGWQMALDFKNNGYRSSGAYGRDLTQMPGYVYTRNNPKFEDVNGSLLAFAANIPGIVQGTGFFARPVYRNFLLNSQMVGRTTAFPTNWSGTGGSSGPVPQCVGSGTENGVPYIDVRFAADGTQTQIVYRSLQAGPSSSYVPAVKGEGYSASVYARLLSGSVGRSITLQARGRDSTGGNIETLPAEMRTMTPGAPNAQRYIASGVLQNDATATINWQVEASFAIGEAADFTVRFYAPQLTKSLVAGPYVPTTAGALQTDQDDMRLSFPTLADGDWIVIVAVNFQGAPPTFLERPFVANDGSAKNRIMLERSTTGQLSAAVVINDAFQSIPVPAILQSGAGKAVWLLRRRAGRYSVAARNSAGSIAISPDSAIIAAPQGVTLVSPIANGGQFAGSSPMNGVHEFLGYQIGTFTDAQTRDMLTAFAQG